MKKLSLKEVALPIKQYSPDDMGIIMKQVWPLLKQIQILSLQSPRAAAGAFEIIDLLDMHLEKMDDEIVNFWKQRGVDVEQIKDTAR